MFTYESTFTVRPLKNRLRVRRKPGQRWEQRYTVPTFKPGFQIVSVWAGFSMHGRTCLVGISGKLNQRTYRSIIDAHILPFKKNVHCDNPLFILQEYNCGPHHAKAINSYLYLNSVNRMQWPAM